MKIISMLLVALLLSTLLAACAAPSATADGAAPITGDVANPQAPPPMSKPLPPREAPQQAGVVDYGCATSADCAVKDVGNCCGAQPACVNKDSPTDPAAVQAQCQASGMMSVCGFQEISACQCVSGRCAADATASSMTLPAQ